jgi:hypothetical protein
VVRSRFGYSGLPTVDVDPTGCITFSSSTGGSVMAAVGGGTASSVTVDLSFDTEGGVLLSSSVMVALAYAGLALGGGIQPIGMLATNCPTVCHLLRFALMIIVNLTVGVGAKFGIAFMYWSSPPWHGFGWSMT